MDAKPYEVQSTATTTTTTATLRSSNPNTVIDNNNNYFNTNISGKRSSKECSDEDDHDVTENVKKRKVGEPRQFWKAGDYEASSSHLDDYYTSTSNHSGFADHVRVHPRFLHSNATSHKWSLGAFAELLDNALDEACNGATYVNVDVLKNQKMKNKMLLIEDNGGGMDPDKMRQCMSLGYSEKSKMANTIGQYGNGFKTSTMRLGADAVVFSRSKGENGTSPTQSVGLLSYTFLRSTGKEDIVVPMVDYEKHGKEWKRISRNSSDYFEINLNTIIKWSPYHNEEELNQELDTLNDHGTRIIIYNLWETDAGEPELDLESDPHDILTRTRDEKKEEMANKYPNLRSLFTYQFSLRGYASILYLTLPPEFRICLRGVDIVHHKLVENLMMTRKHTYRPMIEGTTKKDPNIFAVTTLGFVKEAKHHIDIQGFNVYHKNRLIMPLWRVWTAAGTGGRGVVGVLEANFIEPSHNKQGFECTKMMAKLVTRLAELQKDYWYTNSHEVGYVGRPQSTKACNRGSKSSMSLDISTIKSSTREHSPIPYGGQMNKTSENIHHDQQQQSNDAISTSNRALDTEIIYKEPLNNLKLKDHKIAKKDAEMLTELKERNLQLKERLHTMNDPAIIVLHKELQHEKEKRQELEKKLEEANEKLDSLDKEHEALAFVFQEERESKIKIEEELRAKLKETVSTRQSLKEKLKKLENKVRSCKH